MDSEWSKLKGKVPYKYGALPCVVVDGKRFRETTAILRMLAIRFGLCTMDPASSHQNDVIIETCNDTVGMFSAIGEAKDQEAYKEAEDKVTSKFSKFLDEVEAKMAKEGWS